MLIILLAHSTWYACSLDMLPTHSCTHNMEKRYSYMYMLVATNIYMKKQSLASTRIQC